MGLSEYGWIITKEEPCHFPEIRYFKTENEALQAWEDDKAFYGVGRHCLAKVKEFRPQANKEAEK